MLVITGLKVMNEKQLEIMKKQPRVISYIAELYIMIQKCKESLAIANILNNHLLYSLNTRQILIESLTRSSAILLSSIIKDKDAISLLKVRNILQNEGKICVPGYETKKKEADDLIKKIDQMLEGNYYDNESVITWRDQYYAHFDKRWYSNGCLKDTNDDLCITVYNMVNLIAILEPLIEELCKLFDIEIRALQFESDVERFLEIVKAGEKYLN